MINNDGILYNWLLTFDIFSFPIQFTLGSNKKAKKTLFGGILTILIVASSFSYLVYLCNLFFSHLIQPTISTTNEYIDQDFEMDLADDIIGFRVRLESGQTLQDYESEKGKRFVSFLLTYNFTDDGNKKFDSFLPTPCKSDDLQGYLCIKFQSILSFKQYDNLKLKYFDNIQLQNVLLLSISKCIQALLPPGEFCETNETEIQNVLFNLNTQFQVKTVMKQFNPQSKQYEQKIKQENYLFDDLLAFGSTIQFQNIQTRIMDGFIIQSTQIENNISDYLKFDTTYSQQYLFRILKTQLYGVCAFSLGTNGIVQTIQYQQFTSILAQFISVFHSLLVLGVACRKFGEFEIVQDLLNLQLKVYYKKTALDIIQKNQVPNITNNEQTSQQLLKVIQDTNFSEKIKQYTQLGFIQSFLNFL